MGPYANRIITNHPTAIKAVKLQGQEQSDYPRPLDDGTNQCVIMAKNETAIKAYSLAGASFFARLAISSLAAVSDSMSSS